MFARDRDLLSLEPTLFRDVAWRGQRLLKGAGDLAAGTLTLSSADVNFEDARVETGHIVLLSTGTALEPVPLEVLERSSAMVASVSLLREDVAAASLLPPDAASASVEVWTFAPQIALAHAQLMRAIGIEPGDGEGPGSSGLGEDFTIADILNTGAVRALEAVATLAMIYAAASGADARFESRAADYRRRFGAARQRTPVHLGLDGHGRPRATRRFDSMSFLR
jgi:hypothetical protein